MAFDTNKLLLHIRRLVYSSIRLGYQSACDYPIVLGAGIVLLFLHEICPSVFTFLLSSSPVFILTALLLGVLLSYAEPTVPLVGGETLENQETLSLKSKISITGCSINKVENVAVEAHLEKRTDSGGEVYVRERASDDRMHDTPCDEKKVTYLAADTVLSEEEYVEERTSDDNMHDTHCEEKNVTFIAADTVLSAESCKYAKSNVIVEREEHAEEISEKAELQELGSTNTESGNNEVHNQYQLGEFMRSCWQPVMRQYPCSDSEYDLTESSPDASITDIIPMLEELHPPIDLGTGHPSLASRDNLNSSSDGDEDDLEEEDDVSSDEEEGAEGQNDDGDNWTDVIDLNSLDMEDNSKLENLLELQRAKNILKFELDKRLMDLQAADATQKLKEASSFHVQVPSISTLRQNPFDPSKDSEDTIELPQIPDSAPSVFLSRRNLFELPFDQIVDHGSRFQETWTPCSHFPARQHRKHRNLYGQHSTYLQHQNGIKLGSGEISGKDACDGHSGNDAEQEGNNGKLFGSLEAHIGEEIKILSAAISDVGMLEEVNYGIDEGKKNANISDEINSFPIMESISSTSEEKDTVHAGSEQSILCSLPVNNSEPHVVEADSMSEVNLLFKCRMEEVLVQSISERSIGQPLTVKPEDELSVSLPPDCGMHVTEASSVEELDLQFARLNEEALTCAASGSTCS